MDSEMAMQIAETGLGHGTADTSVAMVAFGLLVLASHLGGRLFWRLNLSEVTGQLLGGAIVGPYVLSITGFLSDGFQAEYGTVFAAFHFFIFVFLGMVAFAIGEELHIARLKRVGRSAGIICLLQAGITWVAISGAFYFVNLIGLVKIDLLQALLLGSIGIATAPAITFVLMNRLSVEGRLRHVLGSMVVLDDMIEVIIFSVLLQISLQKQRMGEISGLAVLKPVSWEIAMALVVGALIYGILRVLVRRRALSLKDKHEVEMPRDETLLQRMLAEHPSPSIEILLLVMGTVAIGTGIACHEHWPFLLTATFAGFLVANFHSHAIFDSLKIENITPVLNLAFFALIGSSINLAELQGEMAWLAGLYIVMRSIGKIGGTWFGCRLMKEERKMAACLPLLMLPQAGVAAVEAVYASAVLNRPEFAAIILPAIVFFEVVGVFLVDRSLRKWRSWVIDEEEEIRRKDRITGPAEAAVLLLDYLSPETIFLDLKGQSKKAVIEELVQHAQGANEQHVDVAQALQVLGEREQLAPTGIGNGIAMPHCRLMGLEKPVLILGRSDTPIEYGGVDNIPCDIFLLMLTCARNPSEHLRMLSAAAHILSRENVCQQLRSASGVREVIDLLHGFKQ